MPEKDILIMGVEIEPWRNSCIWRIQVSGRCHPVLKPVNRQQFIPFMEKRKKQLALGQKVGHL